MKVFTYLCSAQFIKTRLDQVIYLILKKFVDFGLHTHTSEMLVSARITFHSFINGYIVKYKKTGKILLVLLVFYLCNLLI